jgi:hypothetical protein
MRFLAEQHLAAAQLVRKNGVWRTGAEQKAFIKKSNSFVLCASLTAKDRGGISLSDFDFFSLTPNWAVIEEQVLRLTSPVIDGPPIVPAEGAQ